MGTISKFWNQFFGSQADFIRLGYNRKCQEASHLVFHEIFISVTCPFLYVGTVVMLTMNHIKAVWKSLDDTTLREPRDSLVLYRTKWGIVRKAKKETFMLPLSPEGKFLI